MLNLPKKSIPQHLQVLIKNWISSNFYLVGFKLQETFLKATHFCFII